MERVDALLLREVTQHLNEHFEPPHGALITVEEVKTNSDLSQAKIAVSVLPSQHADEVVTLLNEHSPKIRHALTRTMVLFTVPKLLFRRDDREERAEHIHRLLDSQE